MLMTTNFMGELQDRIVGTGIFDLEYLFYGVGDDKNVVYVPAVQMGFRGSNVVEYGIFNVGHIKVCDLTQPNQPNVWPCRVISISVNFLGGTNCPKITTWHELHMILYTN